MSTLAPPLAFADQAIAARNALALGELHDRADQAEAATGTTAPTTSLALAGFFCALPPREQLRAISAYALVMRTAAELRPISPPAAFDLDAALGDELAELATETGLAAPAAGGIL